MTKLGKPRGRGRFYEEKKEPVMTSLTPTGRDGFDALAASMNISRSELMEQIGRGLIKVIPNHF